MNGGIFSSILVEIRAAEGGDDAKQLVEKMFQIYLKYCKIKNFNVEIGYMAYNKIGCSKIEFLIEGENVYNTFLPEAGGHRWQRVPETEKKGRVQTSTVTVAVLPLIDNSECVIDKKDLVYDTFCAPGPGGQHRNKVETAVRITHTPSGLVAVCCDEKSQKRNKDRALEVLRARIHSKNMKESADKENAARKKQIGMGTRSGKIKTYRCKENIVIDHINDKTFRLEDVFRGFVNGK